MTTEHEPALPGAPGRGIRMEWPAPSDTPSSGCALGSGGDANELDEQGGGHDG